MQSASVFPHRFSERQGEAAGSARAEAHGPGPRDQAGRADRLHHLHPPPHVRGLGKGDCAVYVVREQNKIEKLYPQSDNLEVFKLGLTQSSKIC